MKPLNIFFHVEPSRAKRTAALHGGTTLWHYEGTATTKPLEMNAHHDHQNGGLYNKILVMIFFTLA